MTRSSYFAALLALGGSVLLAPRAQATVSFQSTGTKAVWTSVGIQHKGKVDEVASPTYKGKTALRMEQIFEGLSGYHSEVRLHEAQGPAGSEVYYGMALYLPPNWIFHPQNVTFQQWARGDVFASPWVLMFVENDEIRVGGSGGVRGVIAKITGKQGRWIRVVTRIRHSETNGLFEVWVDGVKGFTKTGDISPATAAPIRWSVGMYCTRWREEQPAGLNPMVLFHDHQRVATTYEEANPESWTDGEGTSPPPPDAGAADVQAAEPDAGAVDAGAAEDAAESADAGSAPADGPTVVDAPRGGAGGMGGMRPAPKPRDAASVPPEDEDESAPLAAASGGCRLGQGGEETRWGPLAGLALLALLGRRIQRVRARMKRRGS